MKIIGFYKNLSLVDNNGEFYIVNRMNKSIICKGTEEETSKLFIMLSANIINETEKRV